MRATLYKDTDRMLQIGTRLAKAQGQAVDATGRRAQAHTWFAVKSDCVLLVANRRREVFMRRFTVSSLHNAGSQGRVLFADVKPAFCCLANS